MVIGIGSKPYLSHRLAWLYVYGYFPENNIDHENRKPTDNRIENLREVSHQCNLRNTGNPSNNTSGVKGVSWQTRDGKWRAKIKVGDKTFNLGNHTDFLEAVCCRLAAEQVLNWHGCDSSSPAYQYVKENINHAAG